MLKFDYKGIVLDLSGCGRRPHPSAVSVKLEAVSLTRTSCVCPTSWHVLGSLNCYLFFLPSTMCLLLPDKGLNDAVICVFGRNFEIDFNFKGLCWTCD